MSTDTQLQEAVDFVAGKVAHAYRAWVKRDDVHQELAAYVYGKGRKLAADSLAEGGEKHRLYLALFGVGKAYGEQEKAAQSGYSFDDVAWYDPETLRDLLPLAADPEWDGLVGESGEPSGLRSKVSPSEGGTLLAMICDVRRALSACPAADHVVRSGQTGEALDGALRELATFLGGDYPSAPNYTRRRVLSNAAAQGLTRRKEAA